MEKEKIINLLKEKYSDDFTVNLLTQFVIDFQDCFNEYLAAEEVIERLKERVDKIEITEELINGKLDGRYDDEIKTVTLNKELLTNPKYCNYLAFHELIHAITTKDLLANERMMGFYALKGNRGSLVTEAMTEYLTKIRNKNLGEDFKSGYDEIVEQMSHILKIVGEEDILNCFFYNPENIIKLFEEHNMDFDEVNRIFGLLTRKEVEIEHLGNAQKLLDLNDCKLFLEAQKLFDIFSKSIGEVNSTHQFKNKYDILNTYSNDKHNLNKIMEYHYYTSMYDDLKRLIQNGTELDDIKNTLNEMNISYDTLKLYSEFRKIFEKDKTEAAKELYNCYLNNPKAYYDFMFKNYCFAFDKFAETDLLPVENSFYDMEKIIMIGKFLSGHKEYEYDEVSTTKLDTSNGCGIYCFTTSDNKKYMYTFQNCPVERISENEFKVVFPDGNIEILIDDTISFNSNTKSKDPIVVTMGYSENSQMKYLESCLENDELEPEVIKEYKEKLAMIKERIQGRRTKSMQGEQL